jgi:hypothetical protein
MYTAKLTEESRSTRAPKSNLWRCCNNLPNRTEDKRLPVGRASIVLLVTCQATGPTLTKVWLPGKKKQIENLAMFKLWESYLLLLCARTELLHFQKEPNLHWLYFRIESWLPDSENKTRRGVVWSVIAVRRTRSARAETKIVQVCPAPAYPATNFKDRRIMSVFELNLSTFCY